MRPLSLQEVLIDELRDMYSAENQLVKALPKLAKGANSEQLKDLFTMHLEETKGQVVRLQKVFELLGEKATGEHCNGMEGVIEEGSDALEKEEEGASFDAGLVGAALRTEHYEIAGYTATISVAAVLGMTEIAGFLKENLEEEETAVKNILAASQSILEEAVAEPEMDNGPKSAKEKTSERKSKEDEKKAAPDVKKAPRLKAR